MPELVLGELVPHTVWVLPQWWPTYADVPVRTSTIILYISADRTLERARTWCAVQHYSYASGSAEGARVSTNSIDSSGGGGGDVNNSKAGPCAKTRCVFEIDDPVLIPLGEHGLPILAHSFNHLGWIEEREVDADADAEDDDADTGRRAGSGGVARKKLVELVSRLSLRKRNKAKGKGKNVVRRRRALKMVTFPDPGVSPVSYDEELDGYPTTVMRAVTLDVPEHVLNEAYHIFIDPAVGTITVATISNALHVFPYS